MFSNLTKLLKKLYQDSFFYSDVTIGACSLFLSGLSWTVQLTHAALQSKPSLYVLFPPLSLSVCESERWGLPTSNTNLLKGQLIDEIRLHTAPYSSHIPGERRRSAGAALSAALSMIDEGTERKSANGCLCVNKQISANIKKKDLF